MNSNRLTGRQSKHMATHVENQRDNQRRDRESAKQDYQSLPLWRRTWYRFRYHKKTQKLISSLQTKGYKERRLKKLREQAQEGLKQ